MHSYSVEVPVRRPIRHHHRRRRRRFGRNEREENPCHQPLGAGRNDSLPPRLPLPGEACYYQERFDECWAKEEKGRVFGVRQNE
jgi:hypothetical protein